MAKQTKKATAFPTVTTIGSETVALIDSNGKWQKIGLANLKAALGIGNIKAMYEGVFIVYHNKSNGYAYAARPEQWTALGRIAPNATIANNYAYIFLAEGCRKVSGRHLDATECMETAVLSAEIMEEMIAECRVIQAVHVAAYYMAREKHRETDAGRGGTPGG